MNHIRPSFLKLAFTVSMLLWASIAVTPATAASVTFHFQGTVGASDGALGSTFSAGQSVKGSFAYDPAPLLPAHDSNPTSGIGRYNGVLTALQVTIGGIGGYVANLNPTGSDFIEIRNQPDLPGNVDGYVMRAPVTGSLVNDVSASYFRIEFIHSPSAFTSEALQAATLGNLFSTFRMGFSDNGSGDPPQISGTVSLVSTPLPPAVILFGAGLVALIGLGAGSWRLKGNNVA